MDRTQEGEEMIKRLLPVLLLALTLTGCPTYCTEINNPVTPEYPCGTRAHGCSSSGGCCYNQDDCGGDVPNCPEGYCCYRGGDSASLDGGDAAVRHDPTLQWKP